MPRKLHARDLVVGHNTLRFGRIVAPYERISDIKIRLFCENGNNPVINDGEMIAIKDENND